MKRKTRLAFAGCGIAVAYFVLSALPAIANESGTVTARVAVAAPCLTVSTKNGNGTLDFGTLSFSTALGMTSSSDKVLSNDPTWSNCASATENVYAKGSDATSAQSQATWSLFNPNPSGATLLPCNAGANKYAVNIFLGSTANVWLSTANQLVESLAPSGGSGSYTHLEMPCSGSGGAGETMNFTITFTASL
jgi:hypothetical protein